MQEPRFETIAAKLLVGKKASMSFAQNTTFQLWQSFMPVKSSITNAVDSYLYSVEVYPSNFFASFNPTAFFEKWAAVEVSNTETIPAGMESLTIPAGLYAVFMHKGPASEGPKTYNYIFTQWLPYSDYQLDERPHFALMGEKYQNNHPESEEEIWIPLKLEHT